ncbi:hypothetical protein F5Y06DRAFT_13875 [Hypoxylon sp. FL0890]|nr:hypothetical protein F5Y06DRAFT_13875 [Hypoxylon sp. FL0890]
MTRILDLLAPADNAKHVTSKIKEGDENADTDNVPETMHFTVEFILDVLCPWCYIGLKNLNNAITAYKDRHPGATFEITCSPFLLDPLAPRSEKTAITRPYPVDPTLETYPRIRNFLFSLLYDKPTYLNVPKYSIDQWAKLGEPVGINFSWKGRTGNTKDAHKLLRFALEETPTTLPSTAFAKHNQNLNQSAQAPVSVVPRLPPTSASASAAVTPQTDTTSSSAPGNNDAHPTPSSPSPSAPPSNPNPNPSPQPRGPALQLHVLEALFKWHHESDGDLSDRCSLASTGAAITGYSTAELLAVFESEEWGLAIDELFLDVSSPHNRRGLNIRAVPTFVVNDRYVIGGLQSQEFFVEEFERIGRGGGVGGGGGGRGAEGGRETRGTPGLAGRA